MTRTYLLDNAIKEATKIAGKLTIREQSLIKGSVIDVCIDFENRTCENCNNWNPNISSIRDGNGREWIDCDINYIESENCENFGCNKWERK